MEVERRVRDGGRERGVRKVRNLSSGAHEDSQVHQGGRRFNPHVFPATQQTGGHSIPQTLCTPGNSPDLSVGGEKIGQAHQVLLFCIYFHIEILLFYRALKNSTEMTNWHLETSFPASIGL